MNSHNRTAGLQLYLLLTAIALAAFLASLDGFIINVALTTITGELGVRVDVGTWMITLFSTASTVCVPLSGYLSSRLGDFRLFVVALLIFAIASLLAGLSHNFEILLLWRVFQGIGAGLLTPVSLAMIINHFPQEKRGVAVGFWSFFVMVGPAMGPMIGGWLADYRWHWLFFLNIPVVIFSISTVTILLKEKKLTPPHTPLDKIGMALFFTWVGLAQVAMNRWNIDDWFSSPFIVTLFVIAAICLAFFILWEVFHPDPFINFSLLGSRQFGLPSLTTGLAMGLLFSSFVLDSLWVQKVLGYTPAWAGLSLAPVGLFPLIFYPLAGRFVGILDLRIWVIGSFLLYAVTFLWLSQINIYTPFWHLAIARLIQGIGFAFFTVPNSLLAIQGIPPARLTSVISLFSFVRMLFVGFGISLSITLWIFREAFYENRLAERTDPASPIFNQFLAPFKQIATPLQSKGLGYQTILNEASTLALADIYYLFAWCFLGLCLLVFLYRKPAH